MYTNLHYDLKPISELQLTEIEEDLKSLDYALVELSTRIGEITITDDEHDENPIDGYENEYNWLRDLEIEYEKIYDILSTIKYNIEMAKILKPVNIK